MTRRPMRCAIYTRKSSEEGLEQDFNSLDAQREACAAYIESQRHEGWKLVTTRYDDGGYSGGTLERPGLRRLMSDIDAGKIDLIVVYKIDRLTRALNDFAKLVERLDARSASFVSVTQSFNTTTSMGRLTLNVLLSFAQFEREVTGERIRDKIAASKERGMWMGGCVPIGYDCAERKLVVNEAEAKSVRRIFELYSNLRNVFLLRTRLADEGIVSKVRRRRDGTPAGGVVPSTGALFAILRNRIYRGEIEHKGKVYPGQHTAIVKPELWDEVSSTLEATKQRRTTRADVRSPLRGLIVDHLDRSYEPVHTTKGGRRYRYYVSRREDNEKDPLGKQGRLPAVELESQIAAAIAKLLTSESDVLGATSIAEDDAARRGELLKAAASLAQVSSTDCWIRYRTFIQRVVVRADAIDLALDASRLRHALLGHRGFNGSLSDSTAATITLSTPVGLYRTGHDLRLVVNNGPSAGEAGRQDAPLMKLIARGRYWYKQLTSGEMTSLHAIASAEGLSERYISRVISGSLLAPDIIEKIAQGRHPVRMTVKSLKLRPPILWEEQRRQFGMPL